MPMRTTTAMPSQYAEKFPATSPERMSSDAPPSRAEVTTSRTWPDSVDVNTLTSPGMIAPASVPHVMTVESFHQREPSPRSRPSAYDAREVGTTETTEVIQTSELSGRPQCILSPVA